HRLTTGPAPRGVARYLATSPLRHGPGAASSGTGTTSGGTGATPGTGATSEGVGAARHAPAPFEHHRRGEHGQEHPLLVPADQAVGVDELRYCAQHPEGTIEGYLADHPWRKPSPGMILDLMQHWPVRRAGSFVIGDRPTDIEAGAAVGLPGFLFAGGDLDAFV